MRLVFPAAYLGYGGRMSPVVIQDRFVPVPASVSEARLLLDGFEGMISTEKRCQLKLLVSELVTNSIVHAGLTEDHEIGLRVALESPSISVEVCDDGVGFERPHFSQSPDQEAIGGRGLYIVEMLVERWGVYHCGKLTVVWFELAC